MYWFMVTPFGNSEPQTTGYLYGYATEQSTAENIVSLQHIMTISYYTEAMLMKLMIF